MIGETMSNVFVLWSGGSSYGSPDMDDLEVFGSLTAAKNAFADRYADGSSWVQDFPYVNRAPQCTYVPAVDRDAWMNVYLADPTNSDDPYPDRLITFGPKGGVRSESC
jgi:hypothetical protein